MDRKEILERIDAIQKELAEDQFDIMKGKILERKFHHHKSDRKILLGRIIEKLRRRLMLEVELILEPMLENQKEINLRLLEEVRRIKKDLLALQENELESFHAQDNQKNPAKGQE